MNLRRSLHWRPIVTFAAIVASIGLSNAVAAPPSAADSEQGTEILTRGPVHEAFAETVNFNPDAGVVAPKLPPEAIEELAPDQRPDGDNVAWIPGYWAWDDERNDFLWVSGIWRDLPPGRQWVAGYWGASGQGAQWTSGYWADADRGEIEYLAEPPESVENGPNIAATSTDQTWLPGNWIWQQNRYVWRPGFWSAVQPNWVWVPDHYVWAPLGYVYVDGYWDYPLGNRGILFAPAYFSASVYSQRGFSYSPTMVIDTGLFTDQLFLRPSYGHYYFGDYYATSYYDSGFFPWFSYHNHHGYDPFFAHQRWQHRQDRDWEHHVEADFKHRRDHQEDRPPHTWLAQKKLQSRDGASDKKFLAVAKPFDQVTRSKDGPARYLPLDEKTRQQLSQHGQELRKFRGERQKLETKPADAPVNNGSKQSGPARVKLSKSPIVGKSPAQFSKELTLPKKYTPPQPDLKIEPKPRNVDGNAGRSNDALSNGGSNGTNAKPQLEVPKPASKKNASSRRK